MHEFGIAQGLLETVLNKAEENRATCVTAIKLDIGLLSGVEEEALQFAFTALSEGTPAERATLLINKIPVSCFCGQCQNVFECRPFSYQCPHCGKASHDVRTGRELNLIAMEVA